MNSENCHLVQRMSTNVIVELRKIEGEKGGKNHHRQDSIRDYQMSRPMTTNVIVELRKNEGEKGGKNHHRQDSIRDGLKQITK